MTEKDYKTACRMITYDKIKMLRDVEHQSIQWIADHLGLNFRTVKKYLHMDRSNRGILEHHPEAVILSPTRTSLFIVLVFTGHPLAQMHDWLKELSRLSGCISEDRLQLCNGASQSTIFRR